MQYKITVPDKQLTSLQEEVEKFHEQLLYLNELIKVCDKKKFECINEKQVLRLKIIAYKQKITRLTCPYCSSKRIKKYGYYRRKFENKYKKKQRYKCNSCQKNFDIKNEEYQ